MTLGLLRKASALLVVAVAYLLALSNMSAQPTSYCNPETYTGGVSTVYYYCYTKLYDPSYNGYYDAFVTEVSFIDPSNRVTFDRQSYGVNEGCFINTEQTADVMLGTKYTLRVHFQPRYYNGGNYCTTYPQYCYTYYALRVFIDWNEDGDFEDQKSGDPMNEFIYYSWQYMQAFTDQVRDIPITIPCNVPPGKTRLRVMASYYYPYSGYAYTNNACINGYYYSYGTYAYSYGYGETEDYYLNFTSNITASFPDNSPDDRTILYANEAYDGTQRVKNGAMTNFYKPQVTFTSPQPAGTYLNYKIVGPLPSTNTVYEALDPVTGSTDVQVGGFGSSTYEIQKARGIYSYPTGNSNGSFLSANGGEYRVQMKVFGAGCPGETIKTFTVAWNSDLSVRDIISPRTNTAPRFFKYLRGNSIKVTGRFQNVGLTNVTKFNARAVIIGPNGPTDTVAILTKLYDTANAGQPPIAPKQKVDLDFTNFHSNVVGIYKLYMSCDLLSAIDQETYNNTFARPGDQPYTFEIQNEIQLQANQVILPAQGQVLLGNRPVIPKGEFKNVGVGDASDIPARLVITKLSDGSVWYNQPITVQDVPSGKYNTKTEEFPEMKLKESGDYKACLIISHPDDQVRVDDTTCVIFTVNGGLNGTYTIGTQNKGKSNNFDKIEDAMDALYYRGLAGSVTFELTDALYNVNSPVNAYPAWDFTTYIINSGYVSSNEINTITFKPSASRALTRGGVTVNLNTANGKGIVFGQSIQPSNKYAIFNEFATKINTARKYANSKGYITFDGGSQKALRFVVNSTSGVHATAFYLGKGSENITIKNVLVENGTPSLSQNVWLPMTMYSPIDGFVFQNDTNLTKTGAISYSAGIVMRSTLDKSEFARPYQLDTVPVKNNVIENNEISGFGYGVLSLGLGELLIERTGDYQRFYNTNNMINNNLIHDVYRTGIYLGYEENSNITNNRIYNVGGNSIAAAGIIAGGDGDKDYKGYNNIGLNISGNEISGVTSGSYSAGIKVEQQRNTFPHSRLTQVFYPDVPESMKLTNNVVWGINTTDPSAAKVGIHLFTERGANIQTPANADYLTRNDVIMNNTVIIGSDALVNTGLIAGIAMQQTSGARLFNNAIEFLDNEADDANTLFAAVFYEGTMPKDGGITSDRNAFWIPSASQAAAFRFIETDASDKILDFSNRDDYKTLSQWQAWTHQDVNSLFGDFSGDLTYTGTDPNRKLRINGTPMGSILNNRADRIEWLTNDIDGNLRGAAGQRYDIGAFEFAGGMRVSDMEVSSISSPFVYRAASGTFGDAEYVMTTSPVEVKALVRNDGSIQASGVVATVKIYKETPAGTFSTSPVLTETVKVAAASTETIEAAFNLADGKLKEFKPQTYADLKADGYKVADHFKTMQANVTPRYRIDVEVESDQYNANNISSKVVRFYILHSNLGMVVSAENSYKDIATGTPTKDEIAGRLNYDTLMRGFNKIGWMANPDSNRTDIDIFDRTGWEPKTVNYDIYRTVVWSDGDDKALARFQRSDLRNFLNSGTTADKKNLIIGSQEMVRTNEPIDQAFVREVLSAVNVVPGNPLGAGVSNDGNSIIGLNVGRGLSEKILATRFAGDQAPYTGLMSANNASEGLALPAFYYKNHSASKKDSVAGVAGSTMLRNVILTGIDWRHNGSTDFVLREAIDFIEKNGGTVIPVDLTEFTATARDKRVDVEWATASEFNSDRFEVERAERSNGVTGSFVNIATEKAAGKSNSPINYGPVVDRNVEMNHIYVYRLRMFDKDGSSKLSGEAVAALTGSSVLWLEEVTPSPVMGEEANVSYTVPQSGQVELALYDMAGRKVMTVASGSVEAGSYNLKLNVSSLTSGAYNLILTSGNETVSRQVNIVR